MVYFIIFLATVGPPNVAGPGITYPPYSTLSTGLSHVMQRWKSFYRLVHPFCYQINSIKSSKGKIFETVNY